MVSALRPSPPQGVRKPQSQGGHGQRLRGCYGDSAPPRQRLRSKAQKPGKRSIHTAACTWSVPRSVRLPLLYQGEGPPLQPRDARSCSTPSDIAVLPETTIATELERKLVEEINLGDTDLVCATSSEKVETLLRIFDTAGTGFMGFSELSTMFSVLAERDWADRTRFNEWCSLLGAAPSQGLDAACFAKLLSLEQTFTSDAYRMLGLETMPASKLNMTPSGLRIELLRSTLDGGRPYAVRLARSWCTDFLRLLTIEVTGGSSSSRLPAAMQTRVMPPEEVMESLEQILFAAHEFVDATVSAVERWHMCFQGYLRRATLDACIKQWASFDATWGAKIASLMAQVRSVHTIKREVAAAGQIAKIDTVWRYIRSAASLRPSLEASRQHGLVMPAKQLARLEDVAKRVHRLSSFSPEPPEEMPVASGDVQPEASAHQPCEPQQPRPTKLGPRGRKKVRAATYVQNLRQAVAGSASTTPSTSTIASPNQRSRSDLTRGPPREHGLPQKSSTAPAAPERHFNAESDLAPACMPKDINSEYDSSDEDSFIRQITNESESAVHSAFEYYESEAAMRQQQQQVPSTRQDRYRSDRSEGRVPATQCPWTQQPNDTPYDRSCLSNPWEELTPQPSRSNCDVSRDRWDQQPLQQQLPENDGYYQPWQYSPQVPTYQESANRAHPWEQPRAQTAPASAARDPFAGPFPWEQRQDHQAPSRGVAAIDTLEAPSQELHSYADLGERSHRQQGSQGLPQSWQDMLPRRPEDAGTLPPVPKPWPAASGSSTTAPPLPSWQASAPHHAPGHADGGDAYIRPPPRPDDSRYSPPAVEADARAENASDGSYQYEDDFYSDEGHADDGDGGRSSSPAVRDDARTPTSLQNKEQLDLYTSSLPPVDHYQHPHAMDRSARCEGPASPGAESSAEGSSVYEVDLPAPKNFADTYDAVFGKAVKMASPASAVYAPLHGDQDQFLWHGMPVEMSLSFGGSGSQRAESMSLPESAGTLAEMHSYQESSLERGSCYGQDNAWSPTLSFDQADVWPPNGDPADDSWLPDKPADRGNAEQTWSHDPPAKDNNWPNDHGELPSED